MEEKLKHITNNLKAYRARAGYTQEDVANLLGITRATYCNYEVNPAKVDVGTLQKIADILHCNLSDFFVLNVVTNSNI